MQPCLSSAFIVCVIAFVVSSAHAQNYTITDLGTLGGSYSFAYDINNTGQVTGYSETASGEIHAFLYDGGTMQDLGTLGGVNSLPSAINDSGQVVGYSFIVGSTENNQRAFLYDGGTMRDLGTLGGAYASAYDINDSGQVVGYSETSDREIHAFLYDGDIMRDLGTLIGTTESYAYSINDGGQVVGWSFIGEIYDPQLHAFLYDGVAMRDLGTLGGASTYIPNYYWTAINERGQVIGSSDTASGDRHAFLYDGGTMQDLGTLGGTYSAAYDINDGGQVVGYSGTADGEVHAFLYEAGAMQDLGTLGGASSFAYDINESGQVVGTSQIIGDEDRQYPAGFLYDGNTMLDLCALTDCTVSGWSELLAWNINDQGDITGYGRINGETHAFLITVSVPPVTRRFPVTDYTITLGDKMQATFGGTTIEASGIISCIGPDNQRVVAYFLADGSPVPAPTTTHDGKWGPIFLPKELMGQWTDLLRNEKPLFGYINTDRPQGTSVSTGLEPVGEGGK